MTRFTHLVTLHYVTYFVNAHTRTHAQLRHFVKVMLTLFPVPPHTPHEYQAKLTALQAEPAQGDQLLVESSARTHPRTNKGDQSLFELANSLDMQVAPVSPDRYLRYRHVQVEAVSPRYRNSGRNSDIVFVPAPADRPVHRLPTH